MANSKEKLIAKKYAEALASVKLNSKIIEDLELVKACFDTSADLNSALSNPSIKVDVKRSIIKSLFSSKVEKETLSTILLLLNKRRIDLASSLLEFYKTSFYKSENIECAEIQSARKLNSQELLEIKQLLEKSFNKTIEMSESSDISLIAGLKIKIANKVIDSSLKSKLKQLKTLLTK